MEIPICMERQNNHIDFPPGLKWLVQSWTERCLWIFMVFWQSFPVQRDGETDGKMVFMQSNNLYSCTWGTWKVQIRTRKNLTWSYWQLNDKLTSRIDILCISLNSPEVNATRPNWCHQTTSHYMGQCWPRSILPNDVTRTRWLYDYEDIIFPAFTGTAPQNQWPAVDPLQISLKWTHRANLFFQWWFDPGTFGTK